VVLDLGPTFRADPIRNEIDAMGVDRLLVGVVRHVVARVE